jgi:hypothetical protein
MRKMTFPVLAAALFVAPALAGAQSPSPSSPQSPSPTQPPTHQAPAPAPGTSAGDTKADKSAKAQTLKGELVKVDADAKTITVKGADGVETEFAYTATTNVPGGSEGVSGLATKSGSKVTVHYTNDMGKKTATKIELADKADKKTS